MGLGAEDSGAGPRRAMEESGLETKVRYCPSWARVRVGSGWVTPSGVRTGGQWGSNRGRWLVGPSDGLFWEGGRGDRERTQRMIKATDYSSGVKRRIKQGGDVLRERLKGLDIMMRPCSRCQMIKEAEKKWAVVRVRF